MAQRRMFNRDITGSDSFTDLPLAAQALYLHLTMEADDDGLISNARKITRSIGAQPTDLQDLLEAGFLLDLGDNILCVKHWRMNNYIQKDRYKPSVYAEKVALLYVKPNKAYTLNPDEGTPAAAAQLVENYGEEVVENSADGQRPFDQEQDRLEASPEEISPQTLENSTFYKMDTTCIQDVSKTDTQVRIGKSKDRVRDRQKGGSSKRAYGPHENVMLTDQEAAMLEAQYKYPVAILHAVSNYLLSARDRPPDKQNHYALCLKFAAENQAQLRIKEA